MTILILLTEWLTIPLIYMIVWDQVSMNQVLVIVYDKPDTTFIIINYINIDIIFLYYFLPQSVLSYQFGNNQ